MKINPIDRLFRAFADQNRLRILNLLSTGEVCVCDLMAALKMPQSKVSRHLAYLRDGGLVSSRRDGLWIYYSLAKPKTNFHKRLVSCLDHCLDEAPIMKKDLKTLQKLSEKENKCL